MRDPHSTFGLGASLAAMFVLPFWLGTCASSASSLVLFCIIAGLGLTVADGWSEMSAGTEPLLDIVEDAALRTLSVAAPATPSYFVGAHLGQF